MTNIGANLPAGIYQAYKWNALRANNKIRVKEEIELDQSIDYKTHQGMVKSRFVNRDGN